MERQARSPLALACAVVLAATLALLGARAAYAKAERTAHWKYEQVWPAAVRFLRVDEGLAIVEKDSEAGYVIFRIKDDGKEYEGALEIVRKVVARRPSVHLKMRIEDRPDYMAAGILRRMVYKLREELGPPPPAPPEPPAEKKPAEEKAPPAS